MPSNQLMPESSSIHAHLPVHSLTFSLSLLPGWRSASQSFDARKESILSNQEDKESVKFSNYPTFFLPLITSGTLFQAFKDQYVLQLLMLDFVGTSYFYTMTHLLNFKSVTKGDFSNTEKIQYVMNSEGKFLDLKVIQPAMYY